MKKIILVLLILLTASFADFVIKKDGTLTKVVNESTVPETPPKPDQPNTKKWKNITASKAVASKWRAYGNTLIKDEGEYTKIIVGTTPAAGHLYIDSLATAVKPADGKSYQITFTAYTNKYIPNGKVYIRNMVSYEDKVWALTNKPIKFSIKAVNHTNKKPYINFSGLQKGTIVYVRHDIKIEEKIHPAVYPQPTAEPFKGASIEIQYPANQLAMETLFSDLSQAGVRHIRLQLHPKIMKEHGLNKQQFLKTMENQVKTTYIPLLEQYEMSAFLSMENMPYESKRCSSKLTDGYWTDSTCIQDFRETAHWMANAFKDVPYNIIFAYQFMSEPVGRGKGVTRSNPDIWYELSEELITIVRQYDTERFIVWTRGEWGSPNNYYKTVPFDDPKIIYNFHNFGSHSYTHQGVRKYPMNVKYPGPKYNAARVNAMIAFRNRNNGIPVMVGSYGISNWIVDRTSWLKDTLELYKNNNLSSFNFIQGSTYRGWDLRYTSTYKGEGTKTKYIYNKSNPAWKMLSNYWKGN